MSHGEIIRAWKDAEYRSSLSEAARAVLPAHPSGIIELSDAGLHESAEKALRVKSTIKAGTLITYPRR